MKIAHINDTVFYVVCFRKTIFLNQTEIKGKAPLIVNPHNENTRLQSQFLRVFQTNQLRAPTLYMSSHNVLFKPFSSFSRT